MAKIFLTTALAGPGAPHKILLRKSFGDDGVHSGPPEIYLRTEPPSLWAGKL